MQRETWPCLGCRGLGLGSRVHAVDAMGAAAVPQVQVYVLVAVRMLRVDREPRACRGRAARVPVF